MPKPERSRSRWLIIVCLTVGLTLVAWAAYYPFSPAARQRRGMEAAEVHRPNVERAIRANSAFEKVDVVVYTLNDGGLRVRGAVRTEADRQALVAAVMATAPPVEVTWGVLVLSGAEYDEFRP